MNDLPDPTKVERLLSSIEKHPLGSIVILVLAFLAAAVAIWHK